MSTLGSHSCRCVCQCVASDNSAGDVATRAVPGYQEQTMTYRNTSSAGGPHPQAATSDPVISRGYLGKDWPLAVVAAHG